MHMKKRITLTIEPEISHRAKAVARARGTSLSGLVEKLLASEAQVPTARKEVSFSKKWGGRLKIVSKIDPRFDYLKERYSL